MLHRKRMKTELEKRIESERIYNRPTVLPVFYLLQPPFPGGCFCIQSPRQVRG